MTMTAYFYNRLQQQSGDHHNNTPYRTPDEITAAADIGDDYPITFELWQPGFVLAQCTAGELRQARANWNAHIAANQAAADAYHAALAAAGESAEFDCYDEWSHQHQLEMDEAAAD